MILSAALVLLGGHATSGYTVTDLGHFAVTAGSGVSINIHDEVAMIAVVPIQGANAQDWDTDVDTYVWSNGTTTHIENPASPGDKTSPITLKDDGSILGAILGVDMAPTSLFTWSKSSGFAVEPNSNQPAFFAVCSAKDTYLIEEGVDSTHSLLKAVQNSNVLSQAQVGEFFQPTGINEDGVIIGVDSPDGGDFHAVRVNPGQSALSLAMPPNPLSRQATSSVYSINDSGRIVGSTWLGGFSPANPETKMGAIWAPDGTLTTISDANGLTFWKINNHNQVIGWKGLHHATSAVVYDTANGLRDLNSLVPAGTPTLVYASAINDNGSIVCVSAADEVFLLKPTP